MKFIFYIFTSILLCAPQLVFAEAVDSDADGLDDELEIIYHTNPNNPDTDGDGFFDGDEIKNNYSPHAGKKKRAWQHDYDKDGLNDFLEKVFGSDIGKPDSDGDGADDYTEVMSGYNPADSSAQSKFSRRLEVDLSAQRMYYLVDSKKVLNLPVSTGNPYTPTPKGEYKIYEKTETKRYIGAGYDLRNVKWNMQFKPGYFIHSAYWHNDFGKKTHSHGCVNLRLKDAELLYKYIDNGTPVVIKGETPKKRTVGL